MRYSVKQNKNRISVQDNRGGKNMEKRKTNNPNGRPRKDRTAVDIISKMLAVKDVKDPNSDEYVTRKQYLFQKLYDFSVAGDMQAMKLLVEHGFGKPTQVIEQDINLYRPAQITFEEEIEEDGE